MTLASCFCRKQSITPFVEGADCGFKACLAGQQNGLDGQVAHGPAELDAGHLRHVVVDDRDRHALLACAVLEHRAELGELEAQEDVAEAQLRARALVGDVLEVAREARMLAGLGAQCSRAASGRVNVWQDTSSLN
ncbi:MAG: hypothetical protein WDN31_08710 [Hyphomicrobium sp.]